MARRYAEISHFRAPFKNWPAIAGYGDTAVVTTTDPVAAVVDTEASGTRVYKPSVAAAIMNMLGGFSVIFIDNNNVKLDVRTAGDVRPAADVWAKQHAANGLTVVAGSTGGVALFAAPAVVDRYLSAVSGAAAEKAATAGISPLGAVLLRGSALSAMFNKLGPVGVAAVALLGVGAVVMLLKKKRHTK